MKNKINILLLAVIGITTFAFSPISIENNEVKVETSNLTWKAYKVTGSHYGTIALKSGNLKFTNEKLTGGNFIIDMSTIAVSDLEGEYKGKLEGHLNSPDFFDVANNKEAKVVFTKVKATGKNAYSVNADITIKGITKNIEFETAIYGKKANAAIKIDRTDFDIKYGSASFFEGLKDKAIYDEFDIIVDLEF